MSRVLDWLWPTQRLVAFLERAVAYEREKAREEIAYWRSIAEQSRAREQRAIEQLLAVRVGAGPLSNPAGPTPEEIERQMAYAERELAQQEEWQQAGMVG